MTISNFNLSYYPNKVFPVYNIDQYKKYMLTKETKDSVLYSFPVSAKPIIKTENIEIANSGSQNRWHFQPKQNDSLFWCLFVLKYGEAEYNRITHNFGVKELEEKQLLALFINNNKSKIKGTNYKVSNVMIQEILSESLTIQKETSFNVLNAMTVFYDINILIVDADDRCMLEFWADRGEIPYQEGVSSDKHTFVLYKDKYGKYSCVLEWISVSTIKEMRDKYMVLDSYLKPIRAASNFKVDELVELAKKLSIYDENKKYKKEELYDAVRMLCVWK